MVVSMFKNIKGIINRKVKPMAMDRECGCGEERLDLDSPTRKISQIDEQLQILDKNIKDLNEIVMIFGLYISRILRSGPKRATCDETRAMLATPLANELALKNKKIEEAISHLNWYIERVEIDDRK